MFEPGIHEYEVPFGGDARAAFGVARTTLLSQGFEIVSDSETEMVARGPGMHSNQQSPIVGVSDFRLLIAEGRVAASATLGGVAKMRAFVYLFPPGLAVALILLFTLLGVDFSWTMVLWAAPWLVLSPWMASSMKRKTVASIERLVRGMVQARA
jgi:hypothetical protein